MQDAFQEMLSKYKDMNQWFISQFGHLYSKKVPGYFMKSQILSLLEYNMESARQ